MPPGLTSSAVLWVTAGKALPSSLRRLHPGSFLITPRGSRRGAAFKVSGCWAYPCDRVRRAPARIRREAA